MGKWDFDYPIVPLSFFYAPVVGVVVVFNAAMISAVCAISVSFKGL